MEELTIWIEDNAAPHAKATSIKYPTSPQGPPIQSDGFSSGEQSYMNISVNTAFSVGSAISDTSPPTYIFQDTKTRMSSDDSTLEGSQTNSSRGHNHTWADTVVGRKSAKGSPDIIQTSIDQSTIVSDLESSRAEVETLKSKVAQLEAERAEQQKVLADTVQEQVSKAVQDQLMVFPAQMTQMFANLVSRLHQVSTSTIPKRSAQDMEEEQVNNQNTDDLSSGTSKRWDKKKTPVRTSTIEETNQDQDTWQTPDYLEQIASQSEWSGYSTPQ
ncbi:hypothetical protein MHU86_22962 [Fragilaria crotonensis]|nr:hypothetical protein MHU86_22962 [Fragilaria crotonensis]